MVATIVANIWPNSPAANSEFIGCEFGIRWLRIRNSSAANSAQKRLQNRPPQALSLAGGMPRGARGGGRPGGVDRAGRERGIRDQLATALMRAEPAGHYRPAVVVSDFVAEVGRIRETAGNQGAFLEVLDRLRTPLAGLVGAIADAPNSNTKIRRVGDLVFKAFYDSVFDLDNRVVACRLTAHTIIELLVVSEFGDNTTGDVTWSNVTLALNNQMSLLAQQMGQARAEGAMVVP